MKWIVNTCTTPTPCVGAALDRLFGCAVMLSVVSASLSANLTMLFIAFYVNEVRVARLWESEPLSSDACASL